MSWNNQQDNGDTLQGAKHEKEKYDEEENVEDTGVTTNEKGGT